jgi:hypothetical protein
MLHLPSLMHSQSYYEVKEADFSRNEIAEVAPVYFRDGLVFISNRKTKVWKSDITSDEVPLFDIYYVNKQGNGEWGKPGILSYDLTTRFHDGPVTFTPDGREIYFSKNAGKGAKEDNTLGLFVASVNSTGFSNIRPFYPFSEKYEEYNITYPYVSPDGSKLFFCADVPGGQGGYDIYMCTKRRSRWNEPVNLGPVINTSGNEVFPFYHSIGRLYFASNGHEGLGRHDIFFADEVNGKWLAPVNVGEPINSKRDDYALIIDESLNSGYFTTTRNRSHDIFSFESTLPEFNTCNEIQENNYCFVFSEAGSMDLDTTSLKYEWDLGDGTKVRNLTARHCFDGPGEYLIQLNVIDTLTGDVYFSEATYNFVLEDIEQPYITCPDTANVFEELTFDGSETFLKNAVITKYIWDFGDGYKKIGEKVSHIFKKPGVYQVKLGVESQTEDEEPVAQKHCTYKTVVILSVENPSMVRK